MVCREVRPRGELRGRAVEGRRHGQAHRCCKQEPVEKKHVLYTMQWEGGDAAVVSSWSSNARRHTKGESGRVLMASPGDDRRKQNRPGIMSRRRRWA